MSSVLWLMDRSRIVDGRGFCQRSRLLNYHVGPHGYGIQMKGTSLPLVTGTAYHTGLGKVVDYCIDNFPTLESVDAALAEGYLIPNVVVREAVQIAQLEYYQTVAARGYAYMADQPAVQELVREQQYLVEGLIWAWVLDVLPDIVRRGRILEVEHDDTFVFGCTCGLTDGVGSKADHESRDCNGMGLMCKPDFLLETWATGELEYHEFKGTGYDGPSFRDKWEIMVQMFSATLDAERRYGKHVQSVYVHGLLKGKRQSDYNQETGKYDNGPKRQNSIFCYGYRKPAVPPMEPEEWAAQYQWQELDEKSGQVVGRRLGKQWKKAGIWELPDELIPGGAAVGGTLTEQAQAGSGLMSKAEWWAKWIPAEVRRKSLIILGPFSRQQVMVPHFLEECLGEETRWQQGLWELYELAREILLESYPNELPLDVDHAKLWWEAVWPDRRFHALLDRLFPRSYECRRFGEMMKCQFEGICFEREGWQDPLGTERYILRRPHHQDELQQAIDRGCLMPVAGAGVDAEEVEN